MAKEWIEVSEVEQNEYLAEFGRAYCVALGTSLLDPKFQGEVLAVAKDRLAEGYLAYGDLMFQWDDKKCRAEILEELADAVNYLVSRERTFNEEVLGNDKPDD